MFEGDSADTFAGKISLVSMGAERRVSHAQTRERGPPSAVAEIFKLGNWPPLAMLEDKVQSFVKNYYFLPREMLAFYIHRNISIVQ